MDEKRHFGFECVVGNVTFDGHHPGGLPGRRATRRLRVGRRLATKTAAKSLRSGSANDAPSRRVSQLIPCEKGL